jgi:hypothetical protein
MDTIIKEEDMLKSLRIKNWNYSTITFTHSLTLPLANVTTYTIMKFYGYLKAHFNVFNPIS